jgi:hypothetical protein
MEKLVFRLLEPIRDKRTVNLFFVTSLDNLRDSVMAFFEARLSLQYITVNDYLAEQFLQS